MARSTSRLALRTGALVALAVALASCGGDDQPAQGTLPASSTYAARCASPRSSLDPLTGQPYPDQQGSLADEKLWLRSWTDELYLWYREVPRHDPANFATPVDYFKVLKTTAVTASGKQKDQFHFFMSTDEWNAFAQAGVSAGYGVQWVSVARSPPRRIVVAYVEPGSPAETAGLVRGAEVLTVDGVDVVNGTDVDTLNAGLAPLAVNESHSFTVRAPDGTDGSFSMTSANVTSVPVQNLQTLTSPGSTVGYFLFNDHIATAEGYLADAIASLRSQGVSDLVLDVRYNGGGYLDIASQLAYMIAGPGPTAGKAFERPQFNDKHTVTNPVTGRPLAPTPFHGTTLGLDPAVAPGQALPYLGLSRVFVLTGGGTCSASESIVNGLRGVDVTVVQIGSSTCGKPYGFYPEDNCGTTYFSIEFRGVNAMGFGDYADGFTPGGTGGASPPGCIVADDFTHALGDPAEARLAAALYYRDHSACPPATALAQALTAGRAAAEGAVVKPPWRENRIMRR